MNHKTQFFGLLLVLFLQFPDRLLGQEYDWKNLSGEYRYVNVVLPDPAEINTIYLGAKNAVLQSIDGGENWRRVLSLRGENCTVNYLCFDSNNHEFVYAATGAGLFFSPNRGKNWRKIFQSKGAARANCTIVGVFLDKIYLGSESGLLISSNRGRTWERAGGKPGKSFIISIAVRPDNPQELLILCADGLFRSVDSGKNCQQLMVKAGQGDDNSTQDIITDTHGQPRQEENSFGFRQIVFDPVKPGKIYLLANSGVFISSDEGGYWQALTSYGLLDNQAEFLLVSGSSQLYLATSSGVFVFKDDRWQEISLRLSCREFKHLAFDRMHNLYVACRNGLFKAETIEDKTTQNGDILSIYYAGEPEIKNVLAAAVEYAEVNPEKIIRWRSQAAKKGFLPKVTTSIGNNATDSWHWEAGSSTKSGDDLLIRGKESMEWDVSLSWDLGEIIWSSDQTDIDTRSRLSVQLRQDILDEVTKIYFERIRTKIELVNLGITERKKRMEKELRLQELTAHLDALTGGFFSQQREKM